MFYTTATGTCVRLVRQWSYDGGPCNRVNYLGHSKKPQLMMMMMTMMTLL